MKKIALLAFILIASICNAQDKIGNFSFIEVPDRFEFVTGDNPYQLSDMMVFYFDKNGLKAYRENESPNVSKCDLLYADIVKEKSILNTKLSVIIKDCSNNVLYKSPMGKSMIKLYSKAYPDALRDAFKTFSRNDINASQTQTTSLEKSTEKVEDSIINSEVIDTKPVVIENPVIDVKEVEVVNTINSIPQNSFSNYNLKDKSYLLKKVPLGFILYLTQEGKDAFVKIGDIVLNKDSSFSMKDIYGDTKTGYFKANQDLVIQLSDGNEIIYTKAL